MGSFYVNFSVRGASQQELVDALRRRKAAAFIGPEENGWRCFSESVTSSQDISAINKLGVSLSGEVGKPVLSALVHDDDVLLLSLFAGGEIVAKYDSAPDYFVASVDPEALSPPSVTNIEALAALTQSNLEDVRRILLEEDVGDACALHERVVGLLGLPSYSPGFGFDYALRGEKPWADFTRIQ